jgi:hypothetical protein
MLIQLLIGRQAGQTVNIPHVQAVAMLRDGRALPGCHAAWQFVSSVLPKKRKRGRPRKVKSSG